MRIHKINIWILVLLTTCLLFNASACRTIDPPGETLAGQNLESSVQMFNPEPKKEEFNSVDTGRTQLMALATSILKGDPVCLSEPIRADGCGLGGKGESLFCMQDSLCVFSRYNSRYDLELQSHIFTPETVDAWLPGSVWSRAWHSLAEHSREHLLAEMSLNLDADSTAWGFSGDDWFVFFTDEALPFHKAIHTIWRTENGTDYYEYGDNNAYPYAVTGAYILSGTTGFLCQDDLMTDDRAGNFKLFGTFDGGRTWQDMGLALPEEWAGYHYATAFFPFFLEERGIVFVSASYAQGEGEDFAWKTFYFQTDDGGFSWRFGQIISP